MVEKEPGRVEKESLKESIWNSRLFKIGLTMVMVGAFLGLYNTLAPTGVILMGAAWAKWRFRRR